MPYKTYTSKIKEIWDPDEGYIHYVPLPEELLKEMGWSEGTEVDIKVQLTDYNNVLVISKVNENEKDRR
jgi:hypothetical protein